MIASRQKLYISFDKDDIESAVNTLLDKDLVIADYKIDKTSATIIKPNLCIKDKRILCEVVKLYLREPQFLR